MVFAKPPQGVPHSPLLANILLHQLDLELERRGHRFARYADDMIVLFKSRRAAERVRHSLTPVSGNDPQAQGQPCQKQGGTDERMQLSWLHDHGQKKCAGPIRHWRTSSSRSRNSRESVGVFPWNTGCTNWGNTFEAERRTLASASPTSQYPSWTSGSDGACACVAGNSGAGCAQRSSICWLWV